MKNDGLIIDCFAGGGGASVGIEMALGRTVDLAINHDPESIRIHLVNHPQTLHLTEDIFKVDLQKYVRGRHDPVFKGQRGQTEAERDQDAAMGSIQAL